MRIGEEGCSLAYFKAEDALDYWTMSEFGEIAQLPSQKVIGINIIANH